MGGGGLQRINYLKICHVKVVYQPAPHLDHPKTSCWIPKLLNLVYGVKKIVLDPQDSKSKELMQLASRPASPG